MLDKRSPEAAQLARRWISSFAAALERGDEALLARLFDRESYWRNLSGISWPIRTFSGPEAIARELRTRSGISQPSAFDLDIDRFTPRENVIAERRVIEALFRFSTVNGPGEGVVRLLWSPVSDAEPRAWMMSTVLDIDGICRQRGGQETLSNMRDFGEPSWEEKRKAQLAYTDREPDVLIVGGGHGGVSAAAELKRLGYDALVIDRLPRVGDNWRLRYDGLKLHNTWHVNHFRYLPFPVTMPGYLPKDKIANWIEFYVDALDLNFWTGTAFEHARYDEATKSWIASVRRSDGSIRELMPKHIVMASSVSGTPHIPTIPTIENFGGSVVHSSSFRNGVEWSGRPVLVIGSATSGHDIAQELHAQGAKVTMVQRSSTLVMSMEASALYDSIYLGDGPPLEVRDLLNSATPYPVAKQVHRAITQKVKEVDAELHERLRAVGFKLDFGIDETGWPLKFRTRGGGYYFNIGASDLIANREVGLIQASDIRQFVQDGVEMNDGAVIPAEAIVLATGFKGHDHMVLTHFGPEVAKKVGPVWGLDPDYHELRNMWTKTGQPGLWFTGGAFSMSRIYSRNLALQIDAIETGRLEK